MVRAVTLVEVMVVVALVGVLAGLAVPNLTPLATHHRGLERAREILSQVNLGRATAHKRNAPVELLFQEGQLVLQTASLAEGAPLEAVRREVVGFTPLRTLPLPPGATITAVARGLPGEKPVPVTAGSADASVRFCPSSDTYHRLSGTNAPVCGVGNLASHDVTVTVRSGEHTFAIAITAILGTIDLRAAP